jgi:hypothetical protein
LLVKKTAKNIFSSVFSRQMEGQKTRTEFDAVISDASIVISAADE